MGTKYVLCCYIGADGKICNRDAKVDYAVYKKDGTVIYIPICDHRSHLPEAFRFKRKLEDGKAPEEIDKLNPTRLRYRKQGSSVIKTKHEPPKPKNATAGWKWVDEFDRWRNVDGKVVPFKALNDDELLDAVHAIRRANWNRMSSTIAWLKDLYENDPPKFGYPEEELQVGRDEALAKLEELREELVERGML
jgi:hypothetical protein